MSDDRTPLHLAAENLRAWAIIDDGAFEAGGHPDDPDFDAYLLPAHTIDRKVLRVEGTPARLAEKVFESINTDDLAEVVRVVQNVPFVGPKQRRIAEAVKAHLMREDDS